MEDVQNWKDERQLEIDKVGVKDIQFPITILDRSKKLQHTVANVSMFVTLPHNFKGTHMSRFIEVLNEYRYKKISLDLLEEIVEKIRAKLHAKIAHIEMSFPYFIEKTSPVSKSKSLMNYECRFIVSANDNKEKIMEIDVPITTLCPCSKEISSKGAHNQRSFVKVNIKFNKFVWIEEIIEMVEKEASCEVFPLLKREDEKYVTEKAYDRPMFAEDMVRAVADKLNHDKRIIWYSVESENHESIHNHNAYAYIEKK